MNRAVVSDCVRYGTLDASPQGGFDWLLVGATTIAQQDLLRAFRLSTDLCDPADEHEKEHVKELSRLLQLRQLPPVALGSGS